MEYFVTSYCQLSVMKRIPYNLTTTVLLTNREKSLFHLEKRIQDFEFLDVACFLFKIYHCSMCSYDSLAKLDFSSIFFIFVNFSIPCCLNNPPLLKNMVFLSVVSIFLIKLNLLSFAVKKTFLNYMYLEIKLTIQ